MRDMILVLLLFVCRFVLMHYAEARHDKMNSRGHYILLHILKRLNKTKSTVTITKCSFKEVLEPKNRQSSRIMFQSRRLIVLPVNGISNISGYGYNRLILYI